MNTTIGRLLGCGRQALTGLLVAVAVLAFSASSASAHRRVPQVPLHVGRPPIAHTASTGCKYYPYAPDNWGANWDEEIRVIAAIGSENCIYGDGDGSGTELAEVYYYPNHPDQNVTLSGCFHMELTDNGYPMANSSEVCSRSFSSETAFWAGWIDHPYWGTYCAVDWLEWPTEGQFVREEETCQYINGES